MKKLGLFDNIILQIDEGYEQDFKSQLRIENVKRVYILSGIGLLFFVLLLGLDYVRYSSGVLQTNQIAQLLFINHLALSLFSIPVLIVLRNRPSILAGQFRYERSLIYSTVIFSGICLLTMAILSLIDRNSVLLYGIFTIVANFIIIFPHADRVIFNLLSFLIILSAIILSGLQGGKSMVIMYINILEAVGMTIPAFAISTHLFNERIKKYTFEQVLQRKNRLIEEKNKELNELAKKLKDLNAQRSRFYTNITHEFRAPLTIILGMSEELSAKSSSSKEKGQYQNALDMIKRNGNNLLALINQILDLGKLESGGGALRLVQRDVIGFLRYIHESYQSYAVSKEIHLSFLTDLETLDMDFDPEKLQQVYSNLLSNAIKFTPAEGSVKVLVKQIKAADNEWLTIKVADSGIGIASESLPYIFDRFYQVDDKSASHSQGSGIGLALAKELVRFMSGEIDVKSEKGKGTEFLVRLPISRQARKEEEGAEYPSVVVHVERGMPQPDVEDEARSVFLTTDDLPHLLLIEDNPDVVKYLKTCLESIYQIETAYDGQRGIEKALEAIPDIIISDVVMPGKDGYEVCQYLKTDERTSHIPIVLLTAKVTEAEKIAGLEHGADAYMSKPFHKEELILQLKNLVDTRKQLHHKYSKGSLLLEKSDGANTREEAFLNKLNKLIDENISDAEFGIIQLCRALTMSRSQIHRKIKALTNLSTSIYLRTVRLHKAKKLLRTTDMNISEVAYEVGFKDPNYFTHVFVEEFGETPSATRK